MSDEALPPEDDYDEWSDTYDCGCCTCCGCDCEWEPWEDDEPCA